MASPALDPASLTAIPLALAGWLRYLLGVDDEGHDMAVSPDPMLGQLQQALTGVKLGQPQSVHGAIPVSYTHLDVYKRQMYKR